MKTELERTKAALEVAINCIKNAKSNMSVGGPMYEGYSKTLDRISSLLTPPTEYEEVPVARYFVASQPNASAIFEDEELAKRCCLQNEVPVILKGIWKRPKPQSVERSVSVEVRIGATGIAYLTSGGAQPEWKDHPECHGKTGVQTFNWTE